MSKSQRRIITTPYLLLELGQVGRAKGICLGDDRDQVDTGAEPLHDLNIQRLQGVAGWADEVEAGMHTKVDLVLTARLLLLKHIRFVLVIEELDDGHPRVAVVDIVAKARSVDNRQSHYRRHYVSLGHQTRAQTWPIYL